MSKKKPRTTKKPKKEIKPELILTYTESHTGGEAIDPGNEWTDHTPEYIEWTPRRVYIDESFKKAREKTNEWRVESLAYDEDIKADDVVYIVVVRYSTGSTFGHTSGAWHIEGVFKNKEKAYHTADLIKEDEEVQKKWKWDNPSYKRTKKDQPPKDKYVSPHGYKCWRGYFESLEDVQVERFVVE